MNLPIDLSAKQKNLSDIFLTAVKKWPKKIALEDQDDTWSYEVLYKKAISIARIIHRERGADKIGCIIIYGDKSFACVAAILGILFSGYAYLYIDTSWPHQRIQDTLEIAKPILIIHTQLNPFSRQQFSRLDYKVPVIKIENKVEDNIEDRLAADLFFNITQVTPETIAYIVFTSGSTGQPKGVCLSHRAAISAITMMKEHISFEYNDKIANHAAFCYDLSMFDLFCGFSVGATINLVPAHVAKVPMDFIHYLLRYQLNSLYIVNSAIEYILKYSNKMDYQLPLDKLLLTGDFITENLLTLIKTKLKKSTNIWNLYSAVEIPYMFAENYTNKNTGEYYKFFTKFGNQIKYRVDSNAHQEGVLIVEGSALFSGYLTKEVTLSSIQKDPVNQYYTNDMVRIHPHGLELLSRMDRQIKVMGNRIELDDVEINLEKLPDVKEAAVYYDHKQAKIISFITLLENENNISIQEKKIKDDCRRLLPPIMIPQEINIINQMPRTISGKKDRKSLLTSSE